MKISSILIPAAAVSTLMAALLGVASIAQAPQGPARGGLPGAQAPRNYPAPTNLKVLPKDLTGAQVREIMRGWKGSLGVECDECHTRDPKKLGPDGKPALNFADDSKPEKQMARIMYTMTEEIKLKYIEKVASLDMMSDMAAPLTCGTCHRGHEDPPEFVIPKDDWQGSPESAPAGAAVHKSN